MNSMTAASAARDRWHLNDSPPDTPVSQQKEYYYGNNFGRNGTEGGPHTTYTNQENNPYTDQAAQRAAAAARYTASLEEDHKSTARSVSEVLGEWRDADNVTEGESSKVDNGEKPKVLTGSAALQASSIPMNMGFTYPK